MSGGPATNVIGPLIFAVIALASWALRPESRVVGALRPAAAVHAAVA